MKPAAFVEVRDGFTCITLFQNLKVARTQSRTSLHSAQLIIGFGTKELNLELKLERTNDTMSLVALESHGLNSDDTTISSAFEDEATSLPQCPEIF